jgi:hypothetical protein
VAHRDGLRAARIDPLIHTHGCGEQKRMRCVRQRAAAACVRVWRRAARR